MWRFNPRVSVNLLFHVVLTLLLVGKCGKIQSFGDFLSGGFSVLRTMRSHILE